MSKLKLDTRHGYEGCVCDESGPIIAHVTTEQDTELAAEIVAAVNFCRNHNIDPSKQNWLSEHDAELCREQREECAAAIESVHLDAIRNLTPRELEAVISTIQNAKEPTNVKSNK